jgi:hypothetical protein
VDPYPVRKGQVAPSLDDELGRHLALVPLAERAAFARGFRAAWGICVGQFQPIVREWEARWWRLVAENSQLRARIGLLLAQISRLTDRG